MGRAEIAIAMLDPASQDAIRTALVRGLEHSLPRHGPAGGFEIAPVSDPRELSEPEFMMLTISAYTFRVIVLLHFARTPAVDELVSELLRCSAGELTPERRVDCLAELGNTLCGHLKREVARVHPHLGMSTPNRLSRRALVHLLDHPETFVTHVRAHRHGVPVLAASLLVCGGRNVDFSGIKGETTAADQASTLEFF